MYTQIENSINNPSQQTQPNIEQFEQNTLQNFNNIQNDI